MGIELRKRARTVGEKVVVAVRERESRRLHSEGYIRFLLECKAKLACLLLS